LWGSEVDPFILPPFRVLSPAIVTIFMEKWLEMRKNTV